MPSWLFAKYYPLIARNEPRGVRAARKALLDGLSGQILEVGAGTGINFPGYAAGLSVTATDYSPHMLKNARRAAAAADAAITVQRADVQDLPFDDDRFDHALATLVFCSVLDQQRGLAELLRVTKPGGSIRLIEHVRAEAPWPQRLQNWITPAWRRLGDGCRLNLDTVGAVEAAGLVIDSVEAVKGSPRLVPMRVIRAHVPAGG